MANDEYKFVLLQKEEGAPPETPKYYIQMLLIVIGNPSLYSNQEIINEIGNLISQISELIRVNSDDIGDRINDLIDLLIPEANATDVGNAILQIWDAAADEDYQILSNNSGIITTNLNIVTDDEADDNNSVYTIFEVSYNIANLKGLFAEQNFSYPHNLNDNDLSTISLFNFSNLDKIPTTPEPLEEFNCFTSLINLITLEA